MTSKGDNNIQQKSMPEIPQIFDKIEKPLFMLILNVQSDK